MKLALMTGGEAGSNSRIHSNPARPRLILASPIAIILLGQLAAHTAGPAISVWSWIPLHIGYWIAILFLTGWGGGRESVVRWLRPSRGKRVWAFLAVAISVLLALPMISPDNLTLFLDVRIWLPTLFYMIINPCAEEGYWRGLLLDAAGGRKVWLAVLYSSTLSMINHLWI